MAWFFSRSSFLLECKDKTHGEYQELLQMTRSASHLTSSLSFFETQDPEKQDHLVWESPWNLTMVSSSRLQKEHFTMDLDAQNTQWLPIWFLIYELNNKHLQSYIFTLVRIKWQDWKRSNIRHHEVQEETFEKTQMHWKWLHIRVRGLNGFIEAIAHQCNTNSDLNQR